MDNNELQKRHFSALQVKYQVGQWKNTTSDSFLYFILRKAELDVQLTDLEIRWLAENRLLRTIEIISLQQYQLGERERLEAELLQLRIKYHIPAESKVKISSPVYSLLWKLEGGCAVTNSELELLKNHGFIDAVALIQKILIFSKLKTKYRATDCISQIPEEPLYSILKKLETREELSDLEAKWLLDHKFKETLEIHLQREKERKSQLEFAELKAKYQVESYPVTSISSSLYTILKKIDLEKDLEPYEYSWLKQKNLVKLLESFQELRNKRYFVELKNKYKSTQFQDPDPSSHLFLVLKKLEISELKTSNTSSELKELANRKEFQVSESDILYLLKQGLDQTAEIAQKIHFKELKTKYRIVGQLAVNPFYEIMLKLEREERLDPKQVVQLIEEDHLAPDGKIAIAYHRLEAIFYETEYQRTGNKWNLASASSNWRKAEEPKKALSVTENLNWRKVPEASLKAALLVTRGAACRDLGQLTEAEDWAAQAMGCRPTSHQPYTLMGAICYGRGDYSGGDSWFAMAMERGAKDTDDEIKRIVRLARDKSKRREVVEYLLKKDLNRYAWAKSYLKPEK